MSILRLIWDVSLLLAAASLAIMALLILARLASERIARRREAQRRTLIPLLLGAKELPSGGIRGASPSVLAEVATSLIQMVRGEDREAFIERATRLGVPGRLARQLRSWSARTRLSAAQAMAVFRDPGTLDALREALGDGNEDVRLAAALSLAAGGDPQSAAQTVAKLGLGTEEPSLLMVSLFRTIAADRPAEIKALVTDRSTNLQARVAAVEALATTGDYTLVPLIAELALAAPDGAEERPRYLHALGELGHPAARDAVVDGLYRPSMAARAAAARAAGRIGLVEAAGRLAALLDDSEWWVRFRAAEALIRLGEPGRRLLRDTARSGSPRARDAAETMLAEWSVAP